MTALALLRSPLVWAAVAALLAWLAWGQFERANAAAEALRGHEEAARVTSRFLDLERQRNADLILSLEEIADAPETFGCGPGVHGALDRLRARGAGR